VCLYSLGYDKIQGLVFTEEYESEKMVSKVNASAIAGPEMSIQKVRWNKNRGAEFEVTSAGFGYLRLDLL
jgi:hypothetical protein